MDKISSQPALSRRFPVDLRLGSRFGIAAFRRKALLVVALAGLAHGVSAQNVLLIVADDLGIDKLNAYGSPSPCPPTPNLDQLAAGGVRFSNAWASPVCSPARAMIQTGRYAFRTRVGTNIPYGPELPLDEVTIAEALQAGSPSNIATAAFGKWHLGGDAKIATEAFNPNLQGYGHFAGYLAGAFVGGEANPVGYEQWLETVDGLSAINTNYATTENVDDALGWIQAQTDDWFCYLSFNTPHTPFHAPPPELHSQALPSVDPSADPVPFYDAMVEAMDLEIGRLLNGLGANLLATTTIIFVSDNGTDHRVILPPLDETHGKGTLFNGGLRVPLIIKGPNIVHPGRAEDSMVSIVDIFATVLDLMEVDSARALGPKHVSDSVSMLPYLQATGLPSLRDTVFSEHFLPAPVHVEFLDNGLSANLEEQLGFDPLECGFGCRIREGRAIRNQAYKYIRYEDGDEQLFRLLNDPQEQTNLLKLGPLSPVAQENLNALVQELDQLLSAEVVPETQKVNVKNWP